MLIKKAIGRVFSVFCVQVLMLASAPLSFAAPLAAAHAYPLSINDPSLVWSTFLEFTNVSDIGNAIAGDSHGNIFVTGTSHTTWGTPVRAFSGGVQDAYVAKLSSNGTLLWNTFLGGSGADYGRSIAVDGDGNVLVIGTSDTTWGAPVLPFNAITDAFVAKLNSKGGLIWNTFMGSASPDSTLGLDSGFGITLDGSGDLFVTGSSNSTWGNPVRPFSPDAPDAFVAKLTPNGTLTWNTFLGGSGDPLHLLYSGIDEGHAIALDGSGNIYVSGTSFSTWGNPVRPFSYGTQTDGYAVYATNDAFVAKLDSKGALTWNTFLGSPGTENSPSLAVDTSGNVFVTGWSDQTWGAPHLPYSGKQDAFVAQLNMNGELTWNTFLGSNGFDRGTGVALDGSGSIFVTGWSDQTWGTPLQAHSIYADEDAFIAKLSFTGVLLVNTFLGGTSNDVGDGIAKRGHGDVYITGYSDNPWGTPLYGAGGNFVAKVDLSSFPTVVSSLRASPNPSKAASVTFTVTFSRPVSGVDKTDFSLTTTGVTGASISKVTGSGLTYSVVVTTGTGKGTLRLNVIDNDSIKDTDGTPLGGPGSGNGDFTTGEIYGIRVLQIFLPNIRKS